MLIALSPAKSLNFDQSAINIDYSYPVFIDEAAVLISELQKKDAAQIASLMKISAKLSDLNVQRFAQWNTDHKENTKAAVLAFNGEVYNNLDANSLNIEQLNYLGKNLRILSGLYGLLRPFDAIKEYRLEMGTKLENPHGRDLYKFWGSKIAENINTAISHSLGDKVLVNLASNEYFKSVDKKVLKYPIITPIFKDLKNGEYKVISFYAKKARGMMTRFAAQNKIENVADLKTFNEANYAFSDKLSTENTWVFIR